MKFFSTKSTLVFRKLLRAVLLLIIVVCAGVAILFFSRTPSNDREWSTDQAILPYAVFEGDTVTVHNVRNFTYASRDVYTPRYYTKTYDLNTLTSVDYVVEPLASVAVAHTFLSFGFENGDHVAISIEIRKEKGEEFSPLEGLLRTYELMYVIVDERDTIQLRVLGRGNPVYIYPAKVDKAGARALFVDMLTRANNLKDKPEFYNTLTSTCTTNIADHINKISPNRIPRDLRLILPLDSDEFAYELGLIDTSLPFSDIRKKYLVNELVVKYANDPQFSVKIREAQKGLSNDSYR